ncbi:hypothetical protein [Anoxynatronum buryatiense]|uniref:hypothetical protein n=1 Tax=Anoxynatronum buryatiense TaxID=489973 RepID=UPI0024B65222|nr:hypothetical protein [Anoxynatronum buryatiense]
MEQDFWQAVADTTDTTSPVTPTLLKMQGSELLDFHVGLMDLEALLDFAIGPGTD